MLISSYGATLRFESNSTMAVVNNRPFDMSVTDWNLRHADGSIGLRPALKVANRIQVHPFAPLSTFEGCEEGGGLPVLIAGFDTMEFKGDFKTGDVIVFGGNAASHNDVPLADSDCAVKCDPGMISVEFKFGVPAQVK